MTEGAEPALGMIAGRYRLEAELGHGGTATVYRAWDTRLQVARAVKVLTVNSRRLRAELQQRLEREARAMASLDNPHLLSIYDIGAEEGRDFIVMELAEGGSLNDWLDVHGPMQSATAVSFILHMLSALEAAHSAGIVHRDVKPQNILLNAQGSALLADFGIALWDRDDLIRNTQAGTVMGSLAFMAPEQRQDASAVGPSADIYAAGATLYALLTASLPLDLFLAPVHSVRWERVPPLLQPILARATRPEPADRHPTIRALAQDLIAALGRLPTDTGLGLRPSPSATAAVIRAFSDVDEVDGRPVLRPLSYAALPAPDTEPVGGYTPTLPGAGGSAASHPTLIRLDEKTAVEVVIRPLEQPTFTVPTDIVEPRPPRPLVPRTVQAALALAALLLSGGALGGLLLGLGRPADPLVGGVSVPTLPSWRAPTLSAEALQRMAASVALPAPAPAPAATGTTARAATSDPGAAPDAAGLSAVSGQWVGTFGGRTAKVSLRGGASALSGVVSVAFMDKTQEQKVRGRYDETSRTLWLEDIDMSSPSAGSYTATLSDDGAVLKGTLERRAGGANSTALIALRRSP